MKRKPYLNRICLALMVLFFAACTDENNGSKRQKSPQGLSYTVHQHDETARTPKLGDVLSLHLQYRAGDSLYYDTYQQKEPIELRYTQEIFISSFNEGLGFMNEGDSVSFYIPIGQLYPNLSKAPEFLKKQKEVVQTVKLVSVESNADFNGKRKNELDKQRLKEEAAIERYLSENKLVGKKNPDGIYYTLEKLGVGPKAVHGAIVVFNYEGRLLDGTVIESNMNSNRPFKYELGYGGVIDGWEYGLGVFNKGSKGKLLVTSNNAYGSRGRKGAVAIPENATLVYDIEVLDIIFPR